MVGEQETVVELYGAALALDPAERESFLNRERPYQPGLVAEVRSLLEFNELIQANDFMKAPAFEIEARQTAEQQSEDDRTGQLFGHYRVVRLLGEGGMGQVYLADDTELTRQVALKLIRSSGNKKEVLRRFQNERQILANLRHPNIARLLDAGTTGDMPFFVMEYVVGDAIDKYADRHNLTITERLEMFLPICAAVQYAHQNLVIHRDIKPSNILVTEEGGAKLLDFGIAKLLEAGSPTNSRDVTATALRVMTPEYASPEQLKGEPITTASDVYSLGVLLYELLTGHRPYRTTSQGAEELAKAIKEQQPEKPSIAITRGGEKPLGNSKQSTGLAAEGVSEIREGDPKRLARRLRGDVDNIALMALRKEPSRRYTSAGQFAEDIRRHLEGLPVIARKDTFSYRATKFVRRNKIGVTAAGVILLTLIGGIFATTLQARRANRRFNDVRRLANSFMFEMYDEIDKGPVKAKALLLKRALEQLDSLSREAGNDAGLQRELATAYMRIGDIQGGELRASLGDTMGASASYSKALALFEKLAATEPQNASIRHELAASYARIGQVNTMLGDSNKALDNNRKALAIVEELSTADPSDLILRTDLAALHRTVGESLGMPGIPNLGDTQGALEHLRTSAAIFETLPAHLPPSNKEGYYLLTALSDTNNNRLNLASARIGLATVLNATGARQEATANNRKAIEIYQSLLAEDPKSILVRRDLAVAYGNLANDYLIAGDAETALSMFRQALPIYESLVAEDPHDFNARKDLALGYRNMGKVLSDGADKAAAADYYRKSLAILEELVAKDPANAFLRRQLAFTHLRMSMLLSDTGDLKGAVDDGRKAVALCEALIAFDPKNSSARNTLALSYSQLGKCQTLLAGAAGSTVNAGAHWQEAKGWYQKSLNIWQQMQNGGTLAKTDSGKPDEVTRDIARCDDALLRYPTH